MSAFMRFAQRAGVALLAVVVLSSACLVSHSQAAAAAAPALAPIVLPAPQMTGGMPLMQALANRVTTRTFSDKALTPQQLSNLLWAAFGVNRKTMTIVRPPAPAAPPNAAAGQTAPPPPPPANPQPPKPGRTAPSGQNKQEVALYVLLAGGAYVYDPVGNQLKPVASGDLRTPLAGAAAAHGAVTIVFVAPAKDATYAQVDVGFIGQNIYLWAASEGLNAWFYAIHGAPAVASISTNLNLGADLTPLYMQTVGYPAP